MASGAADNPPIAPPGPASGGARDLWILIALAVLCIVTVGCITPVWLGDETYHFRTAGLIYETGRRPVFDPLVHWKPSGLMPVRTDILWHHGLALAWLVTGGITQFVAQAYNAGFAALLIAGTCLLGRHLHGRRVGLLSALIAGTVPMVPALSIILHSDMAVASLGVLAVYFAVRKRCVLAGLLLGLSLLAKRNAYYIVPSVVLLAVWPDAESIGAFLRRPFATTWRQLGGWALRAATVVLVCLAVQLPDWHFRAKNFGVATILPITISLARAEAPKAPGVKIEQYDVSNPAFNPVAPLEFFGFFLLGGLLVYPFVRGKGRDYPLLLICAVGGVLYLIVGRSTFWMLRYLLVLVPYAAILSARGIERVAFKRRWLGWLVIAGCGLQFLSVCGYIYAQRQVPRGYRGAFEYIVKNVPTDAGVMTPETYQAVLYTNRRAQWGMGYDYADLEKLFWRCDERAALGLTAEYGTTHLLVNDRRVFDDRQARHFGGYPASFVDKLGLWPSMKRVYCDGGVSIWRIDRAAPRREPGGR